MAVSCLLDISAVLLFARGGFGIERSLLGVSLGADYAATKAGLTKRLGKPIQSSAAGEIYDAFVLKKGGKNLLIMSSESERSKYVTAVQVSGTELVPELDFFKGFTLGMKEKAVPVILGIPTKSGPGADGYALHEWDYSNYSVETKDGVVTSLRIALAGTITIVHDKTQKMVVLSTTEAKALPNLPKDGNKNIGALEALTRDPLRAHCERYPIRNVNDVYYIDVTLVDARKKLKTKTFLFDSGWSDMAITPALCQEVGCQVTGEDTIGKEKRTRKKTGAHVLLLGPHAFNFKNLFVEANEILPDKGVQGVVGSGVLFSKPLIANLRNEYLCFPKTSLAAVVKKTGMIAVPAVYEGGRVWLDFVVNGKPVKGYFLDTGSDLTTLRGKDIDGLKLASLGNDKRKNIHGEYKTATFGPVTVGWANARLT